MNLLTPTFVKSSLSAHSWLGLMIGGLMYIVCLSGTLSIFYEEIERWEQPQAEEFLDLDPQLAEAAFNRYVSAPETGLTEHMYLVFPNAALPRMKVSSDVRGHYLNADGSIGVQASDAVSGFITGLHLNLNLPVHIGVVIVSAMGAILCALIISGFLAHPSIVKDAFKLRAGGRGRLGQVDLHNRLSVWGAPFHLVLALTGAYVGLVSLVIWLFAASMEGATVESVNAATWPEEPVLQQQPPVYAVAAALEQLQQLTPEGSRLLYLIVHDAPSDERFMEFYVQQPGLLAWSENYRFDTSGNYLGTAGYTEGGARQLMYSVYRLHFGHFGGFATKLFYVLLGLSLSVVSVSGINIWLEKRKYRDALNVIWPGLVWGTPLLLVLAVFAQLILGLPAPALFWPGLLLALCAGLFLSDCVRYKRCLQLLTAAALLLLVLAYGLKFGSAALSAGLPLSLVLLAMAAAFLVAGLAIRGRPLYHFPRFDS
jgi:uncharacterized iron-regulated membrane protein